jgi:hypothetical protein
LGNWNADYINDSAFVDPIMSNCSDTSKLTNRNKSGYFYYKVNGGTLTVSGLKGVETGVDADDKIITPTVLYVVGADVYIEENIRYSTTSGDNPSLVIIVQKDSSNNG